MDNRLLIIVPTYNERDNLRPLTEQIFAQVAEAHLLVVDDGSPDGTGELANELARQDPRIQVLHRPRKLGLGTAYIAGFRHGLAHNYRYLMEMDADFSHNPRYLPLFLNRAEAGADLVLGSRYVPDGGTENWGILRKFISRGGNVYARTILGVEPQDLTGGFKCFNRRVLEAIDLDAVQSTGYAFQIELTYRALKLGFHVAEIPIIFVDRRVGQSKMSRRIFAEAVTMCWKLRFER